MKMKARGEGDEARDGDGDLRQISDLRQRYARLPSDHRVIR